MKLFRGSVSRRLTFEDVFSNDALAPGAFSVSWLPPPALQRGPAAEVLADGVPELSRIRFYHEDVATSPQQIEAMRAMSPLGRARTAPGSILGGVGVSFRGL